MVCLRVCVVFTQKSRLKRKSMYFMQQMQPRAMVQSTNTARNIIQVLQIEILVNGELVGLLLTTSLVPVT